MEPANILYTHMVSAAVWAYVMDHLYKWNKVPWITRDTAKLNAGIRAGLAALTSLGIHWAWAGSWSWSTGTSVVVSLPALSIIAHTLWNWFGQYAMQHFGERILDIGRTWRIDPKAFDDLVNAVAEAVVKQLQPAP